MTAKSSIPNSSIWRYLSLAKYIDLLATKSLYFPKASLFADQTEGKWMGHANLYELAQRWRQIPSNVTTLRQLLAKAGDNESALFSEISSLQRSANHWVKNILQLALRACPHKRREYLEGVISSWKTL